MPLTDGLDRLARMRIHRIVPVLQLHTGRIELVCLTCAVRVRPAGTDAHRYRLWRHEPREVTT